MATWPALRPTRAESVLAVALLCLSLAELFWSDELPPPTPLKVVLASVPPLLVAYSRRWPAQVALTLAADMLLAAATGAVPGTLGVGFAWMATLFAIAAWLPRPWPWLAALLVAGTIQDLSTDGYNNVIVDWAFLAFAATAGRIVHRRSVRTEAMTTRLRLADQDRDARTREAVTRERAVIARELHDIVAHSVSLMVVQAGTARPLAERVDAELAGVLSTIEHSGREALSELRRLLGVLRADDDPDYDPVPDLSRLDELIDGFRSAGLDVRAEIEVTGRVAPGVALCAYRVAQEGLTNALRHAETSAVDVTVAVEGRTLTVRVQDDGGTPSGATLGGGSGLIGLRERVLLCGGHLVSGPSGSGYLLEATLPMIDQALPAQGGHP
ncbi:putative Integral membrane sensor signal transduction histidine kinase [metagenome]|uniref:histidine kinase n=1 Tax=metagenome TaxID=256318 RepID=A0A2P2C5K4_9ZZZZ